MATLQITHFPSRTFRLQEEGSLLLLKIISRAEYNHCQLLWVGLWSLIQRTENCWRRWPCAQPSGSAAAYESHYIYIYISHTGRGKGWHGPSGILISRGIDQMSPPAVLHYQNSMYRKLLEKRRPQNNTECMKCPPFLHMESSSLRCQDKTWEQQLSLETSKSDSLFHGTGRGGGHCNKTL